LKIDKISETQSIPEAGITGTVGTTYDSDGNPASLTYPDGRVIACTSSVRFPFKTLGPVGDLWRRNSPVRPFNPTKSE